MKHEIVCDSLTEFVEICAMLVREGISFSASTDAGYIINIRGF